MAKKKSVKNKNTIQVDMPKLKDGEVAYLSNINGNYVLSEIGKDSNISSFENYVEKATFDSRKLEHLYSLILENSSGSTTTTNEELISLAKNTQTDIDKIVKVNGLVKYYINKDDIIGKTIEIIENNINTNYTINYPKVQGLSKGSKKKETEVRKNLNLLIEKFNNQINISDLIIDCVISSYIEGNYVFYLKGNIENGYGIVKYPLGFIEITERLVDGEPLIVFNVQELKTKLQSSFSKYGKMKAKQKVDILSVIEKEVKRDYPEEVYDGYKANDRYTYLNPSNIGTVRINNLGQAYGLTPIFKALSPLLTLETIDEVDRKNISAKAKKVFFQKMRKEGISEKGTVDINAVGYAQASLLQSMQDDVVIYTGTPLVESLEILEPKADPTSNDIVLSSRNRIFNSLGISFVSNESKQSMNTVKISYEDLLKTINKITKKLESVINKFYRLICEENGYPLEYSPDIKIHDTKLLDIESQLKLVDLYYSKIGVSYKTTLETLGLNFDEEKNRRLEENEENLDSVFMPHPNSYTSNSNDIINNTVNDKNKNGSEKSEDTDRSLNDKERQEALV